MLKYYRIPAERVPRTSSSTSTSRTLPRVRKVGGFAHLATLVKWCARNVRGAARSTGGQLAGLRHGAVDEGAGHGRVSRSLGVDMMTGHWEFTYGAERVKEVIAKDFAGISSLAQNVRTTDFGDPVFKRTRCAR